MEAVTMWADEQLTALGVGRTGDIDLNRARPWSTTWRLPTELGPVWLKACGQGGRYEAGLTALLAQVAPEWTLQPLAVQIERGFLLLPDGGPDLRAALVDASADLVLERWAVLLTEYAGLQRRLADFVPHLLAVGVPDLRPEVAPVRLRELIVGMDEPLKTELVGKTPTFEQVCARLGASAVPLSVQHDDLHAGAVLCGADGLGAPAFFDWGDAVVSHPFATLLVTRRWLAHTLDIPTDDARIEAVTDSYLDRWSDVAPMSRLRAELADVLELGTVSRAAAWDRALLDATPEDHRAWGDAVAGWLAELR